MPPTEDPVFQESTFLPSGQLPFAGGAGEAGEVKGAAPHTPHPVAGADVPATAGTSGAVSPEANSRNHQLSSTTVHSIGGNQDDHLKLHYITFIK